MVKLPISEIFNNLYKKYRKHSIFWKVSNIWLHGGYKLNKILAKLLKVN